MEQIAMLKAIELGNEARRTAPPNPWVGCTILKEEQIIGEGYSDPAGGPHAEVKALEQAGADAKGSTVCVTLEPCCHHGRTPPCTESLIEAGVKRVLIALLDPDPQVNGKGVSVLKEAGIEVEIGVMEEEARLSLAPYLHHRTTGMPWCVLKAAISLDGRIAAADGTSKWITSEEARKDVHNLRAESQAILIGSGTALTDQPKLTVRDTNPLPPSPPLRVVLDRSGKILAEGPLFDTDLAPTLIFTSNANPDWSKKGVEIIENEFSIEDVLKELAKRGVIQVLIEGGASIFQAFVDEDLANQLEFYIGPKLLGTTGKSLMNALTVPTIDEATDFFLINVKKLGNSARLSVLKKNK